MENVKRVGFFKLGKSIKFNEPFKSTKIKKYVNESLNLNYYSTGIFEEKCKD